MSVLVTSYNHARYVEEALDSLRRQTSQDFEVIITDDASTDGCADVIEAWLARTGYPAQFIRNASNRGICANRNTALARARGTFVCSLSGDDCYEPERIKRQLACFLIQPQQVAAVYSDMLMIDAEGRALGSFLDWTLQGALPPQGDIFARILAGNFLPAPATMVRRDALDVVGGYDESLAYEDMDMWLRLSSRYHFIYLPRALVRYRLLPSSMSNSPPIRQQMCRSSTKILKKWLDADLQEPRRLLVLNALLLNGTDQLMLRDAAGASETFLVVINNDAGLWRRFTARIAGLPGAWRVLPVMRLFYRGIKNLKKMVSSGPKPDGDQHQSLP